MTALSRAGWLAAAAGILDDLRLAIAPFGVTLAADLQVVADPHPCPGYLHDERVIAFCPPVIEGAVDRARWLFFCRMMGCASLDEASEFYAVALPLIVCHEASHHLRMSHGVASESHFIEEQVCDRMAVAMVEAIPAHRATLAPLRARCTHMIHRLAETFGGSPGAAFVPDVGDVLVATAQLDRAELERLERLATRRGIPLDELLALTGASLPLQVAAAARDLARQYVDTRYTENPAEYWHLGLTWVESYLSRAVHPSLADVLQEHLLSHDHARRTSEVVGVLRAMLAVEAQRAGAAEGLLAIQGAEIVGEIAEHARDADDVLATLVRMWPRDGDPGVLTVLARSLGATSSTERVRLLVRLAGLCGRAYPVPSPGIASDALAGELAAADRTTDPRVVAALLADPGSVVALVEAWEAHGRTLDELPHTALAALALRSIPPRARRALLRLAIAPGASLIDCETVAPLAIDELADPLGPAEEETVANRAAQALLDRLGIDRANALAVRGLPARGGPPWDQFLSVLARGALDPSVESAPAIRAAAARADLAMMPTADDATVARLADALLDDADALLGEVAALGSAPEAATPAALAAEVLAMAARGATLEVVRALAPAHTRTAVANVAADADRRGPIDDVVCDVLAAAVPATLRDRVVALLRNHPSGKPRASIVLPSLAAAALSPTKDAMLTIEKLVHLRTVPLFAGVALEQLHDVATIAVVETYDRDAAIFREGEIGDRLFLVLAGQVGIETESDGQTVALDRLGPSSCFGEMALFDGIPRSATARAATDCRLLTLSSTAIARIGRADPQIYEGFLRVLSKRLRAANIAVARRVTERTSLV